VQQKLLPLQTAKRALPWQAKNRKPRDFRSAAFVNANLNQLFTEIGGSVTLAEQPQGQIATCTQRLTAWLSLTETPEDAEVEQTSIVRRCELIKRAGSSVAFAIFFVPALSFPSRDNPSVYCLYVTLTLLGSYTPPTWAAIVVTLTLSVC
jgi:hypothetical protein